MKINCDIGERGIANLLDRELMTLIDIANIACGGHAGDLESVKFFRQLARENDVQVSAHLSYPDKENFGRVSVVLTDDELLLSLDEQYELMNDVKWIKFHGALYNDLNNDQNLARLIYTWLKKHEIEFVLSPQNSELAKICKEKGLIQVVPEVFAERAYVFDPLKEQFSLMPRAREGAVLEELEDALRQSEDLIKGNVLSHEADSTCIKREIHGETICLHSDAKIALELAQGLRRMLA
ncbi:LamB/YcsF family protein [Lentisphaera profundi]|uniref:LamB/YcsF family protein n=1 Tax=Lentisphaera profundi TaxID=1658616 RepID=A0ABY7VUK7_9BACT|nr:LamB/YcsF family protein [Lentisphaera profundi]WDE97895.1 LamB/YcsF family protein [Lentisphaera profundi]